MTAKKLYYLLLSGVCLLLVGLIASTYGANMLLQSQSDTLVAARTKSQALDQAQSDLNATKRDIAKYKPLADIAKSVVPQDKDQAEAVRELVRIAAAQNIRLGAVTFPSSTLGGKPLPGAPFSQLKPVAGTPGVYDLPITIQSDTAAPVPYSRFLEFLSALEHNRRTALVSGITLQPDSRNPANVSFTLNIDEYVKP